MKVSEKLDLICQALDISRETMGRKTALSSLQGWDSMGIVSIMAMFDRTFGKVLSVKEIESFRTVEDILTRMEEE